MEMREKLYGRFIILYYVSKVYYSIFQSQYYFTRLINVSQWQLQTTIESLVELNKF